jgi:hypothetical protein
MPKREKALPMRKLFLTDNDVPKWTFDTIDIALDEIPLDRREIDDPRFNKLTIDIELLIKMLLVCDDIPLDMRL